jgi:hypothetical protein
MSEDENGSYGSAETRMGYSKAGQQFAILGVVRTTNEEPWTYFRL